MTRTGRFGLLTLSLTAPGSTIRTQALVVAQDRWLVLDDSPVEDVATPLASLGEQAASDPARPPGSVLVRRGSQPLRLWAVIHDLEATPTSHPRWVEQALDGILREVQRRDLGSLALPDMGCETGMPPEQFLRMLVETTRSVGLVTRLRVFIAFEEQLLPAACRALSDLDF